MNVSITIIGTIASAPQWRRTHSGRLMTMTTIQCPINSYLWRVRLFAFTPGARGMLFRRKQGEAVIATGELTMKLEDLVKDGAANWEKGAPVAPFALRLAHICPLTVPA
jgi:hypothetical protein